MSAAEISVTLCPAARSASDYLRDGARPAGQELPFHLVGQRDRIGTFLIGHDGADRLTVREGFRGVDEADPYVVDRFAACVLYVRY